MRRRLWPAGRGAAGEAGRGAGCAAGGAARRRPGFAGATRGAPSCPATLLAAGSASRWAPSPRRGRRWRRAARRPGTCGGSGGARPRVRARAHGQRIGCPARLGGSGAGRWAGRGGWRWREAAVCADSRGGRSRAAPPPWRPARRCARRRPRPGGGAGRRAGGAGAGAGLGGWSLKPLPAGRPPRSTHRLAGPPGAVGQVMQSGTLLRRAARPAAAAARGGLWGRGGERRCASRVRRTAAPRLVPPAGQPARAPRSPPWPRSRRRPARRLRSGSE